MSTGRHDSILLKGWSLHETRGGSVSGTNGLAGAADTITVLARSRGNADATLNITGRDVPEAKLALGLTDGRWTLLDGPAEDHTLSDTRRALLQLLREDGGVLTPKEIAERLDMPHESIKKTMQRMAAAGQVETSVGGHYHAPRTHVPHVPGVPDTSSLSPEDDRRGTAGTGGTPFRAITDEELFVDYEPDHAA